MVKNIKNLLKLALHTAILISFSLKAASTSISTETSPAQLEMKEGDLVVINQDYFTLKKEDIKSSEDGQEIWIEKLKLLNRIPFCIMIKQNGNGVAIEMGTSLQYNHELYLISCTRDVQSDYLNVSLVKKININSIRQLFNFLNLSELTQEILNNVKDYQVNAADKSTADLLKSFSEKKSELKQLFDEASIIPLISENTPNFNGDNGMMLMKIMSNEIRIMSAVMKTRIENAQPYRLEAERTINEEIAKIIENSIDVN